MRGIHTSGPLRMAGVAAAVGCSVAVPHTATQDGRGWDSDTLNVGEAWRLVAARRGSQPYYCAFHPTMRGELVVR